MARPTDYTDELAIEICAKIAEGKALTTICKEEDKPSTVTVYSWLKNDTEFLNMYTRAREDQADTLFDEILTIADDGSNDTYLDADGNPRVDHDNVQRSRLRVEARKWGAAKLKPKKYGDKLDLGVTGTLNYELLLKELK